MLRDMQETVAVAKVRQRCVAPVSALRPGDSTEVLIFQTCEPEP